MQYQPITIFNGQVVSGASPTGNKPAASGQKLQDQFLSLLVSQLKNQNPLEPMANDQFLSQTAQFQALSEMQKLNQSLTAFMSQSQINNASSLIGKQVTALQRSGDALTGVVSSVRLNGSEVLLEIDGLFAPLSGVTSVEAAPAVNDRIDALAELLVDALFGGGDADQNESLAL